jgi:uncharacterized Zn-binding protein involved in type VI secretion
MTQQPKARLGDRSDHGGTIISAASNYRCDGIPVARVTDLHYCPIPGHGVTPIVNGSFPVRHQGKIVACIGSVVGCGAKIITGSPTTTVPFDANAVPPNAFILDESSTDSTFILG